ncbi:hypothetical protein WOLCODRAFT_115930, partial [Wolfiporia cocos MD-104 SS10]
MVSAYRVDSLRNPTTALQEFYRESNGATSENFPRLVSEHYARVFRAPDAFNEIPTLDLRNLPDTFPDRALVRFRAMVQDTSPSSEMYLCKSEDGNCGGWGINTEEDSEGAIDYANLKECAVFWAVSVPAESRWCGEELDGPYDYQERPVASSSRLPYKPQNAHKYPHASASHLGVQIKIYDTDASEKLKSTDVVTFIGILTSESSVSLSYSPTDFLTARTAPSSQNNGLEVTAEVPTLHVLFTRPHPGTLLSRPYPLSDAQDDTMQKSEAAACKSRASQVRSELIEWMAEEALGGDRQAAEWVLLASIARVQSRNPPLLPLSLTLSHFPTPPPAPSTSSTLPLPLPTISAVLEQILPLTHTLPLSLDVLNKEPFVPESKDEDLHAGALQLPQGTVLLVTEAGVKEGKLIDRGVLNIRALQEVISTQTLAYTFPYSQFSFPTDITCIVLSEGSKSAFFKASYDAILLSINLTWYLQTDICVPLQGTPTDMAGRYYKPGESVRLPPPEKLAAFRNLVVGARAGKVKVSEETSEYIQQDFVRDRQQDSSITSDDLIRRMTVARLYALSLHETSLSIDVWESAKRLDEQRRA